MPIARNGQESLYTLAGLVGQPDVFLREYWNIRPLVHHTGFAEEWQRMLSLGEIDFIAAHRSLREPYVRVSMNGAPVHEKRYMRPHSVNGTPVRGVLDVDKLAMEFASNASFLLDSIDRYHPAVRRLCQRLGGDLRGLAEAVVFLTPSGVRGLSPHFDSTEVFVLQLYGAKRWQVFEQIRPLPRAGRVLRPDDAGVPVLEVVTQPGDCLYVPWGCPHVAISAESTSCHMSIQVRPPTWGELVEDLLGLVLKPDEYKPIDRFSASSDDASADLAELIISDATRKLAACDLSDFIKDKIAAQDFQPEPYSGFLAYSAQARSLLPESRISRNHRIRCEIGGSDDNRVQLRAGSLAFAYPMKASSTLSALLTAEDKPISAFAAHLGIEATLKLASHLVTHSVLIPAGRTGDEEPAAWGD